ncbi:MAG: pyrroline-5-carboxylate reductase [Pseudomonadota bacterium]
MTPLPPHIMLVGCGKMGQALAACWQRGTHAPLLTIIDPHPLPTSLQHADYAPSLTDYAPTHPVHAFVLAVKPQAMKMVLRDLKPHLTSDTLVLSIAAGIPCATYLDMLGTHTPFVRAMPNTPAEIGQGIAAAYTPMPLPRALHDLADTLLRATGDCVWVTQEADFDAITALSGSGPAYVFHMIEAMESAGIAAGLSPDIAIKLARQTVIGSAALAAVTPDHSPATLRMAVTSPQGTTESGLNVLMDKEAGLTPLMIRTIAAAASRSKALRNS